jgi:hypothetical protein
MGHRLFLDFWHLLNYFVPPLKTATCNRTTSNGTCQRSEMILPGREPQIQLTRHVHTVLQRRAENARFSEVGRTVPDGWRTTGTSCTASASKDQTCTVHHQRPIQLAYDPFRNWAIPEYHHTILLKQNSGNQPKKARTADEPFTHFRTIVLRTLKVTS